MIAQRMQTRHGLLLNHAVASLEALTDSILSS